jgi:hypothetical protein
MSDEPKGGMDWYPIERRTHPSIEETVGLCAYRLDSMAAQIVKINARLDEEAKIHAEISEMLADLREMVAQRRAFTVSRRFIAWLAGTLIAIAATWHAWRDVAGEVFKRP